MRRMRTGTMTAFFIVFFMFNVAANLVHPVTPSILKELHLSDYMFGLAFASMSFCNFLFCPFWGRTNSRIGSRTSLLICAMGYAVGQVMFGLARTEAGFVFARMFAGAFCGGAYVSFLTYIINRSDLKSRGRNLALNAILTNVSGAAGYFIGGMIGEIDLFLPVWIQVAILVICGMIFRLILSDDKKPELEALHGRQLANALNPFSAFSQCARYLTPLMILLFLYAWITNLGFTAFEQCFNYFIRDQFGFSSAYNGVIKAALGLISLASNLTICMWILRKGHISKPLLLLTAACVPATLGVALIGNAWIFIAVNVVFYTFWYVSLPLTQDLAAELARGGDSNLIMGAFNAVRNFGNIFGALFSGFIYVLAPRLPFLFTVFAFAAGTVLCFLYRKKETK